MENYTAIAEQQDADERPKQINVTSSRCRYCVLIDNDYIELLGPGVREHEEDLTLPDFDSLEDTAIYLVMLFESNLLGE